MGCRLISCLTQTKSEKIKVATLLSCFANENCTSPISTSLFGAIVASPFLPTQTKLSFRVINNAEVFKSRSVTGNYILPPSTHCKTKQHRNYHHCLKISKLNSCQMLWWIKKSQHLMSVQILASISILRSAEYL